MLNIVTVNAGNYQGRGVEYTNVLFDCVRRNLAEGTPGRLIVFTDTAGAYDDGIEVRPLPDPAAEGWFAKLGLFKPGVFDDGDRVLYLDLSALVCGRLDEIAAYQGNFAILRDFYRPDGLQSSVMAWGAPYMSGPAGIWSEWQLSRRPETPGGDQAWIEECFRRHGVPPEILQDRFPDRIISYKVSGIKTPQKASVVVFHGHPKPHEVDGWAANVWKIGGLSRADLDAVCNTERDIWMGQVVANSQRDLPWLDFAEAHEGQVAIVGGAPSLKAATRELMFRKQSGQGIWALNGAFKWLVDQGIAPDAHFIIDARPENLSFIQPTEGVRYFLASQCHPSLFDALDGHDVTVMHMLTEGMQDYLEAFDTTKPTHLLGGGTTVAMKALLVAHEIGFRAIHLYGVDSSYADGEHHAYPQPLNGRERVLDAVCGERTFKAAPWMIQQVTDFIDLAQHLVADGTIITVNGDGLLPHAAREMMASPRVTEADVRASEVLRRLPEAGPIFGAEIGVFAGDMSKALLEREDLTLFMVDSWEGDGAAYSGDSGDWHAALGASAQDAYMRRALSVTKFAGQRGRVLRMRSAEAAAVIGDGVLDFVFIDADHSYDGCMADILAWAPKLKPGGLLSGHDYENTAFPKFGVAAAVNEWAASIGATVDTGDNFTWFIRLPVAGAQEAA